MPTRVPLYLLLGALLCAPVEAAPPPPTVLFKEAVRAPFADRIEALGTLRARESIVLTATVTETVSAIHFEDGNRVEAGTILVEMTSDEEHAQLIEARAAADEARRQYERIRTLEATGQATRSLLDERRRDSETSAARLEGVVSRLADRLVRAPFAGVLGLRNISVGALVSPGSVITTLDDDTVMHLDFSVPSTSLETLAPGLGIEASARAYSGREFRGVVKSIDSRVDPVTRSVIVRAELPNPDHALKPGMLMYVVLLRNPRDALVIPEEALMPVADRQFVLLVDEANQNKAVRREVRIGARRPGEVEVLDGLAPGEKVIVDGGLKVRPGQAVTPRPLGDGGRALDRLAAPARPDKTKP